jgi:xanthine dehydrogenase molybdopterin-binding subunit B
MQPRISTVQPALPIIVWFCRAQAAEKGWSFAQMATQAYMDRVDLSAHGFYATPEVTGGA